MTPADLKAKVRGAHHSRHFFARANMKFAGDTMRNYGVRGPVAITTWSGDTAQCWELYRRRPVKLGLSHSAYFDTTTFEQRHPKE